MILPSNRNDDLRGGEPYKSPELQILVVDDSYLPRYLIASSLLCQGYSIVTARDGSDALNILECCNVDGIVTDLHMPNKSGDELIRQIRSRESASSLPVIVISSDTDASTRRQLLELGASAFLPKPVDISLLLDTTRKCVGAAN